MSPKDRDTIETLHFAIGSLRVAEAALALASDRVGDASHNQPALVDAHELTIEMGTALDKLIQTLRSEAIKVR